MQSKLEIFFGFDVPAYRAGRRAAAKGKAAGAVPYPADSEDASWFRRGYQDFKADLATLNERATQ